ncbi:MAG: MoxR family ATPase, partial [Deltaproteobacteria bacterium]
VSIPELGTRKAVHIPFVVLTSNNYRDISDALKRRCLYLYIDYPDQGLEARIVRMKVPGIEETLVQKLVDAIVKIRNMDLKKKPSISETLDWARSLIALQIQDLTPEVVIDTLNVICKYRADTELVKQSVSKIV